MKQITFEVAGTPDIHLDVLKTICGDTKGKSMIDLMACEATQTSKLPYAKRTFVDIQDRPLVCGNEDFVQSDVFDFLLGINVKTDTIICLDGCEHLNEYAAIHLFKLAQTKAHQQIFFTPYGDYIIEGTTNKENPDGHRSGWVPQDIEDLFPGYYSFIVFPNFHEPLGVGAFFFWHSKEDDFEKIQNELNNKSWAKSN